LRIVSYRSAAFQLTATAPIFLLILAIFGPTDDGFGDIADAVAGLSTDEVAAVLAGHVVPGVFTAADVVAAGCVKLETLAGTLIRVMFDGMSVLVN
jgi:uncharacterized surface protein with fasciclin (FAS1) repeats